MNNKEFIERIKEDLEIEHMNAQDTGGCSCHLNPPCNFCVSGYSLPIDEFVELELAARKYTIEKEPSKQSEVVADYDRAMDGLF